MIWSSVTLTIARTLSGNIRNLDIGRYIIRSFCVSDSINTYHALFWFKHQESIRWYWHFSPVFSSSCTSSNFMVIDLLWKLFHKINALLEWDNHGILKHQCLMLLPHFCFFHSPKYCLCLVFHYNLKINIKTTSNHAYWPLNFALFTTLILMNIAMKFTINCAWLSFSTIIFVLISTSILCCYHFIHVFSCFYCCKHHNMMLFKDIKRMELMEHTIGDIWLGSTYFWRLWLYTVFIGTRKYWPKSSAVILFCYCYSNSCICEVMQEAYPHWISLKHFYLLCSCTWCWVFLHFKGFITHRETESWKIAILQLIPHSFLAMVNA